MRKGCEMQTVETSAREAVYEIARKHAVKTADITEAVRRTIAGLDAELREAFLEEAVEIAVRGFVFNVREGIREACKQNPCTRTLETAQAVTADYRKNILNSWMIGDKLLGDVTGAELRQEADNERDLSSGHARNARFYEAVAAIVPADKLVRTVLTAARVVKILDGAEKKRGG